MVEKFERLIKLAANSEADKKAVEGFSERQKSRNAAYAEKAKSQSPDDAFYAKSYNL